MKWHATVIAASGIITVAALAAAIGQDNPASVTSAKMSIGQTVTVKPAPTSTPLMATPVMKAKRPKGF